LKKRSKRPDVIFRKPDRFIWLRLGIVAVSLFIWQYLVWRGGKITLVLPSPLEIIKGIWVQISSGTILPHVGVTFYEVLIGYILAIGFGVGFGLILGGFRYLTDVFEPILLAAYTIPKIILYPSILMIFGIGINSKISLAAIHGIFPILLGTIVGSKGVNRTFIRVAQSMNARSFQIYWKVYLPCIVLPLFVGLRIGLSLAIIGAIIGEFFEAKIGLGYLISYYQSRASISQMYVVITLIIIIVLSVNEVMRRVELWLTRWKV
jgi:NitT/TauT family transport system permease protein